MKIFFFQRIWAFVVKKKEKVIRVSLGLFLVLGSSIILFINPEPISTWITTLENYGYDLQVRHMHRSLGKNSPITIVDIDDKSLKALGRWPWPREKFADLVTKLYKNGAAVVAFDVTFPDPEDNIAEQVIEKITEEKSFHSLALSDLNALKSSFDYDARFSSSLKLGDSILGMVFTDEEEVTGMLPKPLLQLSSDMMNQLEIPDEKGYLANISKLQMSAKTAGFINATPDKDGILRSTPLLFRRGSDVYGSLSLQAVSLYLLSQNVELSTQQYGDKAVLEGIKLDRLFIPTDSMGRMLIPYRGIPFSFPYLSASDVLSETVSKESLKGKLIFIGSTASAEGDNRPSSIAPVFPGIEVHASVASGIIDRYLPYKPSWGRGVTLLLMMLLGITYALILPFFGVLIVCLLCIPLPIGLVFLNQWIWNDYGLVISIALPVALVWVLFIANIIWGYFFESLRGKELKSIFGQYVPPVYLEEMLKKGGEFSLEGESKELSVLFSDIRNFTNFSEKMTATELKLFLNRYFNSVTEIIFNNTGTIDKYVGDMVMAFWGAPLDDKNHAVHAVTTAMAMQEGLAALNKVFLSENKPQIKIGVGVNTGLMNVGDMGSKFRRSYTVLGDAVNLASRLEGQTKFYHVDVMVGEPTWMQTKEEFAYRKLDKIKVKGKDLAVEVYSPVCTIKTVTGAIQLELETHHKALDSYFNQEWTASRCLFKQLKESYPQNKDLYEVYLIRIEILEKAPPGENWDGAFVSHEK